MLKDLVEMSWVNWGSLCRMGKLRHFTIASEIWGRGSLNCRRSWSYTITEFLLNDEPLKSLGIGALAVNAIAIYLARLYRHA